METPNLEYLRFPVSLIQDYLVNSRVGLSKMLVYGYCLASERLEVDFRTACRQALYCFYAYHKNTYEGMDGNYHFKNPNNRNRLPKSLLQQLYDLWQSRGLEIDEDYFGWNGNGTLDMEDTVDGLIMLCDEKYPQMSAQITDFYRVRQAADLFGLTIKDVDMVITEYRQFRDTQHKGWRSSVKCSLLFDYLNNPKSELDQMVLILNIGVRSIIYEYSVKNRTGDKYCRTTQS